MPQDSDPDLDVDKIIQKHQFTNSFDQFFDKN